MGELFTTTTGIMTPIPDGIWRVIRFDLQIRRVMRRMAYRPGAVREVLIPKPGQAGRMRTFGISNLEDKIVQGMMHKVLAAIYEPLFLDCSYGFRPGRSAHDAVRDLHRHLFRRMCNE